jgi:ABC-type branched-subunit amino acid transport system substrate-binding protein/tRNA A-37 threonylcarbamoyl transferase component Bud32
MSQSLNRGDIAGKYRFIAEIGHGGMSEVFLTLTQGGLGGFQKLVVVKLLRRDLAEDEEFRRMFLQEARLAAQLNHANVVQTYDVGESRGRYYIAMEYLEGQTYERVRRARNARTLVPLPMQVQVLIDVLSGLDYAHELADYDNTPMQIVHRDVTPSNVFITYDGQVKLMDFGIAKLLDASNQTRAGVMKGKARYMAPEQITGVALDRRADIYSVGVMLWEMLSGKQIWLGRTEPEILRRVATGEMPALPPDAPAVLQQICRKAMAHDARDRHDTAEALRVELDTYVAQSAMPSRARNVGAAVAELFQDERTRIRQLVEAQIKGSRPGTQILPMLQDEARATGDVLYEPGVPPTGATVSGVNRSGAISYNGQAAVPPPHAEGRSGMSRPVAILVGALGIGALAAILVVTRERTVLSTPPAHSAAAAVPSAARPTEALAVRGVTDDTITLGMSADFSGASRELGNGMKLGLETAFAVANEAGGVAGRQIKLLALDDGYEGKRALANVQELIADRGVFALVGNVGTPTTKEALPFVLSQNVLLFGAFTGASLLRRDPPDRYVFNYRASYEEETAKMIGYLIDVKKIPERSIVVFAQHDSYGDSGYDGAVRTLRKRGHSDDLLRVDYERNTLDVDSAVAKVLEYNDATARIGSVERFKHPVKAILMVGTYKPCAKFIQKIRDRKLDPLFLNVSFVGSDALANELNERGPGYATDIIVTQVVPHFESGATGVLRYRDALKKYHPDQQPSFVSLEGFITGQLLIEALRRVGHDLDTEKLVDTLEQLHDYDPAFGGSLGFGASQHQASHRVWGTVLDAQGTLKSLELD